MRRTCESSTCGKEFEAQRATKRYCSQACQKRERRADPAAPHAVQVDHAAVLATEEPADDDGSLTWVTIRDLRKAQRLDTPRGRLAVKAARIIDASTAVMGMAALMVGFDRALEKATEGVEGQVDPLDELERRRNAKVGDA